MTSAEKPTTIPSGNTFDKWTELLPKSVTMADSMSPTQVSSLWNRIYKEAGYSSANEDKKRSIRLWVYITGCLNGTSRVGSYNYVDTLSDGSPIQAAIIPRVVGRDIRKFYRGNMEESYTALKISQAMTNYPRFIFRMAAFGASPEEAFAGADWFTDCPLFTPNEARLHERVFNASISRARRARNGQSLEEVEDGRLAASVRVNGPDVNELGRPNIVDF